MSEIDALEDAIIEDTLHCCVCGASFTLGGNNYVLIDGSEVKFTPECNGAFCIECAEKVHKAYAETLREMGICEHGVNDEVYCEECSREYKRANCCPECNGYGYIKVQRDYDIREPCRECKGTGVIAGERGP